MSQQFYSKYRHLFEEDIYDQVQKGYDMKVPIQTQIPQMKYSTQQPKYNPQPSPQKQEYSPFKITQPQQQYQQPQQTSAFINDRSVQSRKNFQDERIRKQVMQDNIFKQPVMETKQQPTQVLTQMPVTHQPHQDSNYQERKLQQQTYNVFQDQDILDGYAPKKQKPVVQNDSGNANNIHQVYLQRIQDLEFIKRKYVDPNQLSRDIDYSNPYKAALMQRVLAQFNGNQRRSKLKEALRT